MERLRGGTSGKRGKKKEKEGIRPFYALRNSRELHWEQSATFVRGSIGQSETPAFDAVNLARSVVLICYTNGSNDV